MVDWSHADDDGKPVEISESAVDALFPEDYDELKDAIEAHDNWSREERKRRKNGQGGAIVSSAISPSPSSSAGDTSGSPS